MSSATATVKRVTLKSLATARHRRVKKIVTGAYTADGMGVKLKRTIGSHVLPDLDPFLLLDDFNSYNVRPCCPFAPSFPLLSDSFT